MKTLIDLALVQIPTEFTNKTAFIFQIDDESFEHLGIRADTIALVDNSQEFSTKFPIAFYLKQERMIGLAEKVLEDLYQLKPKNKNELPTLFSKDEIELIGQLRGIYKFDEMNSSLKFEKL